VSRQSVPRLRRRSRPSLAARFGKYWLVLLVCAVLAAGAVWVLIASPAFHLASLAVTGLSHVSRAEVVRRAAIDPRANIWLLDRRAIESRLAAIPYVASVRMHRRVVANVWLEIHERRAEGCVRDAEGGTFLVDGDLRVLEDHCAPGAAALTYRVRVPLEAAPGNFLRAPELVALQRDARALDAGGGRYRAFAHDRFGGLDATLHDGIAVRFGDEADLSSKQRLLAPIFSQLGSKAAGVRSVDLRAPATPVVEFRTPDARSKPDIHRVPQRSHKL